MLYLLKYRKCWEARFISHLDLLRGIQRALRRSALPLDFSRGFNPHPIISFVTSPLPVSYTSETELLSFTLKNAVDIEQIIAQLARAFPPGVVPVEVQTTDKNTTSLFENSIRYLVFLKSSQTDQTTQTVIESINFHLPEGSQCKQINFDIVDERKIFSQKNSPFILSELFSDVFTVTLPQEKHHFRPDRIISEQFKDIKYHIHRQALQVRISVNGCAAGIVVRGS
ncbi:MAG: TIGR03936 family radical SAM-associated protein [bacterium]